MMRLRIATLIGACLVIGTGVFVAFRSGSGDMPDCDRRSYSAAAIAAVRHLEKPSEPDSVTAAEILIRAKPATIWGIVEHFETVWPESNPAHLQTCVVTSSETVHENMVYHDVERVGGITARMYAHVYDVIPERRFRWKANALYDLGLFRLPVEQGGTFVLEPRGTATWVSHEVWAEFPDTATGKAIEWVARNLLDMEASAIDHNRVELEWFRREAENSLPAQPVEPESVTLLTSS